MRGAGFTFEPCEFLLLRIKYSLDASKSRNPRLFFCASPLEPATAAPGFV
jgi:hypothetical protein